MWVKFQKKLTRLNMRQLLCRRIVQRWKLGKEKRNVTHIASKAKRQQRQLQVVKTARLASQKRFCPRPTNALSIQIGEICQRKSLDPNQKHLMIGSCSYRPWKPAATSTPDTPLLDIGTGMRLPIGSCSCRPWKPGMPSWKRLWRDWSARRSCSPHPSQPPSRHPLQKARPILARATGLQRGARKPGSASGVRRRLHRPPRSSAIREALVVPRLVVVGNRLGSRPATFCVPWMRKSQGLVHWIWGNPSPRSQWRMRPIAPRWRR
mmetsp:Transcript_68263/g.160658  ORF Transcript_68263/g.160658 Transcript_68263/m.160658 type:complete len:264 (-) Transcript_68263:871-1662(-)